MSPDKRYSVLFVCLGNICRSPIAEGVFIDLVKKRGLTERFDRMSVIAPLRLVACTYMRSYDKLTHITVHGGFISSRESAGTGGYHIDEEPDERSTAICAQNGITLTSVCRQLCARDFDDFDYIVGMDKMNIANIERARGSSSSRGKAKVELFGSFGDGKEIRDPYYGPKNGFQTTFDQCVRYSEGLLEAMGFGKAAPS